MNAPVLFLLTDGHEGTALFACPDDETAERLGAKAVWGSGGVSAWRVPPVARLDYEHATRVMADGGTCADLGDDAPERTVAELLAEPPRIEMVTYRDPDHANDTYVFANGKNADDLIEVHDVDPGAGWTRSDWELARESALESASSDEVRAVLDMVYDAGAGSEYVEDDL